MVVTNPQLLCEATSLKVSSTLLILFYEDLKLFGRQKRVQPGISKAYLMKRPVSMLPYPPTLIDGYSCINLTHYNMFMILSCIRVWMREGQIFQKYL